VRKKRRGKGAVLEKCRGKKKKIKKTTGYVALEAPPKRGKEPPGNSKGLGPGWVTTTLRHVA